mgnify:FL=1
MKKTLFILAATAALLSSCKEETCDVSFCDMTFRFTAAGDDTGEFPVGKLQLFLKDNVGGRISGPVTFDPETLKASAVEEADGSFRFSATQRIPRGDYTLWCWANVHDESVYSFDRYSISMKDNITGSGYLLGKSAGMQIGSRLMETSFDLVPVTARVPVTVHPDFDRAVSLYIADVARRVDADGNYSEPGTMAFEADRFENMPPSLIYLFPTLTDGSAGTPARPSEFTLTYRIGTTDYVERAEALLLAGEIVPVTFGAP